MLRTLKQSVTFKGATAASLFDLYVDARRHAAATGAAASITRKEGDAFSAWDGYITGRNLAVVPKRLVVQAWRASDWDDAVADSTLVLAFRDVAGGAAVDLVHAHVPDDEADALDDGWREFYWSPWRAFLKAKPRA